MTVVMDEMRCKLHRARIREGVRFYCHEGAKRVAEGRVVKITGLFNERAKRECHLTDASIPTASR